ncbi:unnamed protein product [Haemonchus placei]|uniref:non-specific serine/threonine protein kinase n=1 Tax=Haemonchus placei TaxID=6290 RepID=A0A0N4VXM3_HAEPC|nr:unnamed protein product [Haemonchus placei]
MFQNKGNLNTDLCFLIWVIYFFSSQNPSLAVSAHSAKEFRRQYSVLEEIGRGGFGIVYRAVRIADGLPVAVKFVEHRHVREWTLTGSQLIPSEVCHLETCSDVPGVIRLIDWFANSKGFLIVMERPENCMDIFDLISTYGKLDEGGYNDDDIK